MNHSTTEAVLYVHATIAEHISCKRFRRVRMYDSFKSKYLCHSFLCKKTLPKVLQYKRRGWTFIIILLKLEIYSYN